MSSVATQLEPREPGRYVRSGWSVGSPGTYALIIGVSDYTHVAELAPFGIGKLYVSALTAFRFFQWLTERYQYMGTGVERVWLLLSPTPAEIAQEPQLATFGEPATFANCSQAIKEWFDELEHVKKDPDRVSRSVVFFSGHGFQVFSGKQLLLPQDYLRPPQGSFNDAISTANLAEGVRYTSVLRHFFFIDACRNDTSKLRAKEETLVGARIINVPTGRQAGAGYAKLLYGSAPGDQTWQPKTATEGLTFYGEALLRGLEGDHPDVPLPDKTSRPWSIPFEGLFQYVTADVFRVLGKNGIDAIDPVEEDGPRRDVTPPVVAHVPDDLALSDEKHQRKPPVSGVVTEAAISQAKCLVTSSDLITSVARQLLPGVRYTKRLRSGASYESLLDEKPDFDSRHKEFGSERLTAFYADAKLYDVGAQQDSELGLRINRVERLPSRKLHVVTFGIPPAFRGAGYVPKTWLTLPGDGAEYGVMLPDEPLRYRAVSVRSRHGSLALNTLRIDLSDDNPPLPVQATVAWRAARGSLAEPIVDALFDAFPNGGYNWMETISRALVDEQDPGSSIAATLAALLVTRTRVNAELDLEELSLLTPWSDLAVLRLESILAGPAAAAARRDAASAVERIVELGVPMLSPVVDILRAVMDQLDQGGPASRWRGVRGVLSKHFSESLAFHRSGGLFPLFAVTVPELLPAWERAREVLRKPTRARILALR